MAISPFVKPIDYAKRVIPSVGAPGSVSVSSATEEGLTGVIFIPWF